MAEQETPTDAHVEKPAPEAPTETGGIPKARLDKVIGERNELKQTLESVQAQLNEIKQAKDQAEREKALKAGKADEIISGLEKQLNSYKTQAEEFQKMQAQRLDNLRSKLPEDKREKYAHITDLGLMETLVDDLSTTGGGAPADRSAVPKEDFGGYGSLTEWANKDMASFSKFMAKENEQSIKWGVVPE